MLLSSWIITIYVSLHFKYIHKVSDPFESFDILYDKPWQRYGPYACGNYSLSNKFLLEIVNFLRFLTGMICGYILHRVRVPPRVPLVVNLLLWAISLSIMFIIIFGVSGGKLSLVTTSLYVSFGHTGKYNCSRRFRFKITFYYANIREKGG
jgi:hypothetical protein